MLKRHLFAALAALSLSGALTLAAPARAEEAAAPAWGPYLVDKKGEPEPFPESGQKLKDADWLRVKYTAYSGYRPRLAVVYSEEKVGSPDIKNEWAKLILSLYGKEQQQTNPFNHIEDLVRGSLMETNRFTMVERTTAMNDALGEQDFGATNRVDKKTAAATGRAKGAEFIVKATIIELDPEKESSKIGAGAGGIGGRGAWLGGIGISGKVAFCRLNVRVVNAATLEIVREYTVDGTAKSSQFNVGTGFLGGVGGSLVGGVFGGGKIKNAPLSNAMIACTQKAANAIARDFEDLPWEGMVASVKGNTLYVNGGTNVGLKPGFELLLVSKGEPIYDPEDSTSVIGYPQTELGRVRVVTVLEKISQCEMSPAISGVKTGDIVRRVDK